MSMIHEITARAPRNRKRSRKGRGRASGQGKTAGRGTKAAHGGDVFWIPGREGGQTPLFRRLPKRGFSNQNFERRYHVVNVADLNRFDDGATVDQLALIEAGLVPDDRLKVKILGNGDVTRRLTTVAGWYSKSAHQKITAAGGTAQNPKGEAFEFPRPKKKFVPRETAKPPGGKKAKGGGEAPPGEGEAKAPTPAVPAPDAEKPAERA
jgi:large subunit ribosomal protein L15